MPCLTHSNRCCFEFVWWLFIISYCLVHWKIFLSNPVLFLRSEISVESVRNPVNVHGNVGVHAWQMGPEIIHWNFLLRILSSNKCTWHSRFPSWPDLSLGTSHLLAQLKDCRCHPATLLFSFAASHCIVHLATVSSSILVSRTQEVLWVDSLFPEKNNFNWMTLVWNMTKVVSVVR